MMDENHPIGRQGHLEGLRLLAHKLGYRSGITRNLETAFTHRSYANEVLPRVDHNERLEFLGDSVLDLVVAEALMVKFEEAPEGELHRLKTTLVCTKSLANSARELGLGRLLRLGKGELKGSGRAKDSLLANAFEAMLGATYLDLGYDGARSTILDLMASKLADTQIGENQGMDPKSRLQELTQKTHGVTPTYQVVSATGPEHQKSFQVSVSINSSVVGTGAGGSKKAAERSAAAMALETFLEGGS